ncbi:MAG: putative nitrogen fixation protein NifT [Oceanospirillaceae bacterium]|nr:putative nitrogen fixation protein NifT [Oceanospirillaceae bacterium]MBT13647.1 putative nitrogen fixation protein NifT [Oceanospirillaceae bacterium]|tara:strand:+ start:57041 stop:57262 length:222 start_codon:yes stop_codon:yes gene_type:complete
MPNVMLRENDKGELTLYVPKKDLEDVIASIEFDAPDAWGGELTLSDGSSFIIDKLPGKPDLPITVRAKRGAEA